MPLLFIYLLKLSVSLTIMYLFYQFVLRRLTFYNHNRWYLLGYSLLCFFIPLINISPVLEKNEVVNSGIVTIVPTVETITASVSPNAAIAEALGGFTIWSWLTAIVLLGAMLLLIRLAIQYFSFRKIKSDAKLIAEDEIKFYQVDQNIIPFSFGNSIFINQQLHTEAELKEIIRHEFVHVKQNHTLDIIWAEILCIFNWYNPFAWLIKKAIRQNLEFIADNKVVENGMDKKQYQYLLLKVIGNNHFSIASNFNFSSLKKRIAMMNKIRSAKVHLIRFLFVLPLVAVLLLSFREIVSADSDKIKENFTGVDTIPAERKQEIVDVRASFSLHRNDKMSQEHKDFFLKNPDINLLHWKANGGVEIYFRDGRMKSYNTAEELKSFENKHGELPQPSGSKVKETFARDKKNIFLERNQEVKDVGWVYDNLISNKVVKINIIKKTGANEVYDVNDKSAMVEFEKKYGERPVSPQREALSNKIDKGVIVAADTIIWESKKGNLYFAGDVKIEDSKGKITVGAREIYRDKSNQQLILLNGVELSFDKTTNLILSGKYQIVTLSDEEALRMYGDKGKNGAVIITTIKEVTDDSQTPGIKIRGKAGIADNPVYYVNGKETSKEAVEFIDPAKIQSINVLKGKGAEQKYGEKGKNGVIEIITIPGPEKINFIEKLITPAWDIKNFLPGKKKDEC